MFIPLVVEVTIPPMASALVEISAMAESPRRVLLRLMRRSSVAHTTTTISVNSSGEAEIAPQSPAIPLRNPSGSAPGSDSAVTTPSDTAMVSAPKPTWDRPSPIMEYRLSTRITPSNAAHSATSVPTISARWMNLY